MDVLTRNNVTLSGRPDGRPVVFAHGFGCDQGMWRHVAPAFTRDHRVVLFDHVGAGGSDLTAYSPSRHGRLEGYATDVTEILDALDLPPAIFVGHSVSAMIGVLAAVDRPERFERLVLVCPSPRYIDDGDYRGGFSQAEIDELLETMDGNYLGWSVHIAPVIMGAPERPELGRRAGQQLLPQRPGDRPPLRAHHLPVGQPRRPRPGAHPVPGAAVPARRDRAEAGG